jgi:hypothetical protein
MSSYAVTAHSRAEPAVVFDLLADATSWSSWGGPLIVRSWWEREGDPPPGGPGAIRRFGLGRLSSREEILTLQPPTLMRYRLLGGLPARDYEAEVRLTADADGTRIDWSGSFQPLVPGSGASLQTLLRHLIGDFARRLAHAAEGRTSEGRTSEGRT